MTRQNAELFAALFTPAQNEPPTGQDTGPRKPAPVPEIGSIGAPGHREAQKMHDFEQAMIAAMNRNR